MGTMLKVNDVAAMLGVKPSTVRTFAAENGLPHFRMSARTVRFPRADVEAWMAARRHG